jgi:hypothetical protein
MLRLRSRSCPVQSPEAAKPELHSLQDVDKARPRQSSMTQARESRQRGVASRGTFASDVLVRYHPHHLPYWVGIHGGCAAEDISHNLPLKADARPQGEIERPPRVLTSIFIIRHALPRLENKQQALQQTTTIHHFTPIACRADQVGIRDGTR